MNHFKIFPIIFLLAGICIAQDSAQTEAAQESTLTSKDSSKASITNVVQIPSSRKPTFEAWWSKLIYLCVGAILALAGGVIRDIIIDRRDKKRIRQAIIAEIARNSMYGLDERGNIAFTYPKMWFTKMFDGNINKISYFNSNEIAHLLELYSWMYGFRELFLDIPKEERNAETMESMRKQANAIRILCQEFMAKYETK